MSVIVKGMKMPENCWQCVKTDLNIAISVFGGMCPFCEKIRTDHDMQTGRHPECPLGALPEKHGRLVDADELIEQMEADAEHMDEPYARMMYSAAISDVRHASGIVEAEDNNE